MLHFASRTALLSCDEIYNIIADFIIIADEIVIILVTLCLLWTDIVAAIMHYITLATFTKLPSQNATIIPTRSLQLPTVSLHSSKVTPNT